MCILVQTLINYLKQKPDNISGYSLLITVVHTILTLHLNSCKYAFNFQYNINYSQKCIYITRRGSIYTQNIYLPTLNFNFIMFASQ